MIPNPIIRHAACLAVIAGCGLSLASAQTTIYEQSFTPGAATAGLNGTSPTIGANSWIASPLFQADGDIAEGAGSATLSFTPANGFIYTLDASFRNMAGTANVGAPEQDWVALGFAKGQSTLSGTNNRFLSTNVIGKAWMLFRGADTPGTLDNVTHLGSATSGNNAGAVPSTSANWSALSTTYGGGIDMRVVLDTTGGTGNWTATWFAKLPASGSFTEVRAATALLNEDINSVGVAISNPGIDGDLTRFSLTAAYSQPVIYSDDFSGDAGDINGMMPDVTTDGATWTASPIFNADGSVDRPEGISTVGNRGSMTLPFTPADGFIYTLDASFSGVTGDTDWLALGFAKGQSSGSTINDRFIMGNVVGSTWMIFRGDNPDAANVNMNQPGLGTATPSAWLALADQNGGDIDLRIVLDTTGGTGAWTATWYAKLPADGGYSLVGTTTPIPHAASNYTSVGIAAANTSSTDGTGGTIESFSLTASGAGASLPRITGIRIDGNGNVILTLDGPADGLTVQQSDNLAGFSDIPSTAAGNTLTIDAANADPDANGRDFYRLRN